MHVNQNGGIAMNNENKISLPKDFFSKVRPKVDNKETLNDIILIKWSQEVLEGKRQVLVKSKNEN